MLSFPLVNWLSKFNVLAISVKSLSLNVNISNPKHPQNSEQNAQQGLNYHTAYIYLFTL